MKTILLFFLSILTIVPSFASGDDAAQANKEPGKKVVKPLQKVCSCELIKLVNNDSKIETVAILAEKTTAAKKTKLDYKIASFELWKERKYLATVFVNDIKLIDKVQEATPCESLYKKLKEKYNELKLQSIIDVDARSLAVR